MYFDHTHYHDFLNGDYTREIDEETIKSILRMVSLKIEVRIIARHFNIPLPIIERIISHHYPS